MNGDTVNRRRSASASGAVALMSRHDLRDRWRSLAMTALLTGIVGGIGLACLAGARRSDTLFERQLDAAQWSHVEIDPGWPSTEVDRALRSMPEVIDASYWATVSVLPLTEDGRYDPRYFGIISFTTDGRYLRSDPTAVYEGRRLDPRRRDEVMLNPYSAEALGLTVGDTIDLGLIPTDSDGTPTQDTPTDSVTATVVGIMALPEEVVGSELDNVPKLFVSPAFGNLFDDPDPAYVGFAWYGLRLRGGDDDVAAVVKRWQRIADQHNASATDGSDYWLGFVHRTADLKRTAARSIRPMVAALATFGALALVGAVMLLTQAMVRLVRQGRSDVRIGQILGLATGEATRISIAVPAVTAAAAAVVTAAVSVALSPRFPAGPYRVLEPHTGLDVDPAMIGLGVGAMALIPMMVAVVVSRRQAREDLLDRGGASARSSAAVHRMARAGCPPPLVSAVRLTMEPGVGRSFVPTRTVMVSGVVTVALLMASMVFGGNLAAVASEPARFGWKADGALMIDGGYGQFDAPAAVPWLDTQPDLQGWRLVGADRTSLNGREVPAVNFGPSGGDDAALLPVMVSGRPPEHAGEVVVGRLTLDGLGLGVGDTLSLGDGEGGTVAVVTGTAVFPELGPVLAIRTRLDDGVWIHSDDAASAFGSIEPTDGGQRFNALLYDLNAGRTSQNFIAAVSGSPLDVGASFDTFGVIQPPEVSTAAAASRAQSALIAAMGVVAVLSLLFTLVAVVRRRQPDLAILAALGFTPGQLRLTLVLQGTIFGLVGVGIGTPLGIALGRQLWRGFAGTLGVVTNPTVAWPTVGLTSAAVVAVAALSALPPAIVAGRAVSSRLAVE